MVVEQFQRQTAIKASLGDVQSSSLVEGKEDQPTALELASGERSGRVSVIAVLVDVGEREGWIDDGTGLLQVRSFDVLKWPLVGSLVHVVGRVREYGSQRYLAVEVVRVIDAGWALVRKRELELRRSLTHASHPPGVELVSMVDQLDDGQGADYESIKTMLNRNDAEQLMQSALESGTLFQVAPGRLKVLR